jgi:general secretion pathway protein D
LWSFDVTHDQAAFSLLFHKPHFLGQVVIDSERSQFALQLLHRIHFWNQMELDTHCETHDDEGKMLSVERATAHEQNSHAMESVVPSLSKLVRGPHLSRSCAMFACLLVLAAAGCQTTKQEVDINPWPDVQQPQVAASNDDAATTGTLEPDDTAAPTAKSPAGKISFLSGTGRFIGDPPAARRESADNNRGTVTLNLAGVSVPQAAKAVLGDILGVKYTVDPGIQGKVTIQTPQPIPKSSAIDLFQASLRSNGAAMINAGDELKIVPADQVAFGANIRVDGIRTAEDHLGSHVQVVQLQYVSAAEMKQLLEPISPRGSILGADPARNTITLSGTNQEIAGILQAISIFDVDVMKGMSFVFVPVSTARPEDVANQLREVFSSSREGPMAGMVRFIPNKQLSAILVVSPQQKYLARAAEWIRRFDSQAEGSEKQFYTYTAQNRRAQELLNVLLPLLGNETNANRSNPAGRDVAPQYQQTQLQTGNNAGFSTMAGTSTGSGVAQPASFSGTPLQPAMQQNGLAGDQRSQPQAAKTDLGQDDRYRIAVDESKNALLIEATPVDYRRIMKLIRNLDMMPKQVLIEVTIAEISLNDELQFGVRWFLQGKGGSSATFTDDAGGSIASVFPGFSYAVTAANIAATLNTLNQITTVNVLSSPSLTVMDNHEAYLQIGDEVPITTQSAVSVETAGAPVINSITYKDTGIILEIMPHISASGRVLLDLQQEVSSVVPTTSSGIDSPTIQQRRIKTSVVVNNGQGLVLGGLIQHQNNNTQNQVPVLGSIPVIGSAFRNKDNTIGKTELMIFITPRVMRTLNEARWVTDEFRHEMQRDFPPPIRNPQSVSQGLNRILQ